MDVGRRSRRGGGIRRRRSTRSADDKWVDGAIGGSGDTARPIIISRIMGGNPPCATQFNPGKDADDLIDAGLMHGSDRARRRRKAGRDIVYPPSQFDPTCAKDGKVWCVPVNLHSAHWMWVNRHVYEDAGLTPPKTWDEVVADGAEAAEKGIIPLSAGAGLADQHAAPTRSTCSGRSASRTSSRSTRIATWSSPRAISDAQASGRRWTRPASSSIRPTIVPQWNDAVSLVITGKAGTNVMGDWAQGEFAGRQHGRRHRLRLPAPASA